MSAGRAPEDVLVWRLGRLKQLVQLDASPDVVKIQVQLVQAAMDDVTPASLVHTLENFATLTATVPPVDDDETSLDHLVARLGDRNEGRGARVHLAHQLAEAAEDGDDTVIAGLADVLPSTTDITEVAAVIGEAVVNFSTDPARAAAALTRAIEAARAAGHALTAATLCMLMFYRSEVGASASERMVRDAVTTAVALEGDDGLHLLASLLDGWLGLHAGPTPVWARDALRGRPDVYVCRVLHVDACIRLNAAEPTPQGWRKLASMRHFGLEVRISKEMFGDKLADARRSLLMARDAVFQDDERVLGSLLEEWRAELGA